MSESLPGIYVVSDSSGETAISMVEAAAMQFKPLHFQITRFSDVSTEEEIRSVLRQAKEKNCLVAYTLVMKHLSAFLEQEAMHIGVVCFDLIGPLLQLLSAYANEEPKQQPGLLHTIDDAYFKRVEAVEFAVRYDDGKDARGIRLADIVLIGVSRTGKTPLSMYLAHKSFKVANIPLVPEARLPEELFKVDRRRLIGLVIDPEPLNSIRRERLKSMGIAGQTSYTDRERILKELEYAREIMRRLGCPIINVTNKAVEETAAKIIDIYNRRFRDER